MSDVAKSIKLGILRVLAEQNVSKNELARRTGIECGNLVRLLNGDRELQTDTIQKIADALSVDYTTFIVGTAVEHEPVA